MDKIIVFHILTGGLRKDGISCSQLEFFKRMNSDKFIIYVAAVRDNEPEMIENYTISGCKVIVFPDRKKRIVAYFFELVKELKRIKPDLVHIHGSSALLSVELLAAKIVGVKIRVVHSRNTKADNLKLDKIMRPFFYMLYTNALACGDEAGKWLFRNRPFTVIHNGKDLHRFSFDEKRRNQKRKELGLEGKIVVGHVGQINQQKNHEYLLKIFHEFSMKHENAILYLIGDGPMFRQVKHQAELDAKISEKVIFVGEVNNVPERLEAMDIMVFPSKFEGLPNVVLEWQAEGLPCLISDKITKECAPSDFVEFASIEDDPKVWADKMEQMLVKYTNREVQAKQGTQALKENGFDIVDAIKQLEDIYLKLLYNI